MELFQGTFSLKSFSNKSPFSKHRYSLYIAGPNSVRNWISWKNSLCSSPFSHTFRSPLTPRHSAFHLRSPASQFSEKPPAAELASSPGRLTDSINTTDHGFVCSLLSSSRTPLSLLSSTFLAVYPEASV